GGLAAGHVAGWAVTVFIPTLRASRLAEATLTIAFAYVIFVVCDHYLGVSGVVAVAAAALAVSAGGRRRLAPSNWESLVVTWEQLAFWASSLIFLFAAMQTPELLEKAPTMRPLMRLLKISSLAPAEVAVSQRVIGLSLSSIPQEIETVGRQHQIAPEIVAEVAKVYGGHGRGPLGAVVEKAELPAELRERVALYVLADREQEFCLDYFESRTVSRRVAASLLAHAARLRDGARSDGIEGYQKAATRILAFNMALRLSRAIHHRIGIARPLARLLGHRFEVHLAVRFVP